MGLDLKLLPLLKHRAMQKRVDSPRKQNKTKQITGVLLGRKKGR